MMHPYHHRLQRVLTRMGNLYTVQDILERIASGHMQSFTHGDSWAITQIMDHPRGRCLEIFAVVGDLEEARILHDRVVDYAFEIGAKVVQAYGRRGFLSDAKQRGWKLKARAFVYQRAIE